jgi:hypothetical protein
MQDTLVLIVGCPRSGTSLLRDLTSQFLGLAIPHDEFQNLHKMITIKQNTENVKDAIFIIKNYQNRL